MIKELLIFGVGIAVGSLATYILLRKNKKKATEKDESKPMSFFEADMPVESSKFNKHNETLPSKSPEDIENKNLKFEYNKILNKAMYDSAHHIEHKKGPYTVEDSDDFDSYDEDGYDTEEWTLYADGTVTSSSTFPEQVVENPEDFVGEFALKSFGEYGDEDHVYVRDDNDKVQYSITKSQYTYQEILELAKENEIYGTYPEEDDAYGESEDTD